MLRFRNGAGQQATPHLSVLFLRHNQVSHTVLVLSRMYPFPYVPQHPFPQVSLFPAMVLFHNPVAGGNSPVGSVGPI